MADAEGWDGWCLNQESSVLLRIGEPWLRSEWCPLVGRVIRCCSMRSDHGGEEEM